MNKLFLSIVAALVSSGAYAAGELDKAVLHGDADKARAIEYAPGEPMVFTLSIQGAERFADGEYFIAWERTGDDGKREKGKEPASFGKSFVYRTSIDKPGFVRLYAKVVNKDGKPYMKKFRGDRNTPEGREAANRFERAPKEVFFDGGAGVHPEKLQALPEPKDFDEFWAKQYARLAAMPIKVEKKELPCKTPTARIFAVEIACAGIRPVTGYLTVPKSVEEGKKFPARLETHGYSYRPPYAAPITARDNEIVLSINAHGVRLPAFGGDDGYYKAFGFDIQSNGQIYAFDPKQNSDPETAYFNGMFLRVKRALQFLKTVDGWNGTDLYASGGSQGGLQTIWAAACGEGVTRADSSITWCCDLGGETLGRNRGPWYIKWVPALGYYDAVNHAKRIPKSCHVNVPRAGLGDYCCPPSGLSILWNNLTCPKSIMWVQGSQHGYVPSEPHQSFTVEAAAR